MILETLVLWYFTPASGNTVYRSHADDGSVQFDSSVATGDYPTAQGYGKLHMSCIFKTVLLPVEIHKEDLGVNCLVAPK